VPPFASAIAWNASRCLTIFASLTWSRYFELSVAADAVVASTRAQTARSAIRRFISPPSGRLRRGQQPIRSPEPPEPRCYRERRTPRSARKIIVSAVLVNLLNPKLTIFFFAFLPQFVSPGEPHAVPRMLALSGVFMLLTFVVFVGYGRFAVAVRDHVISHPRVLTWIRRTFAGTFVTLSARLAASER
jgi:LysE type translocator